MAENLLSEIYWKLHRNSLASSTLLFLSANYLLNLRKYEGAVVDIPQNLQSALFFIWSTYAIIVLFLEGRKDESSRSARNRAQIENKYQVLNNSCTRIEETTRRFILDAEHGLQRILAQIGKLENSIVVGDATRQNIWSQIESESFGVGNAIAGGQDGQELVDVAELKKQIFDSAFSKMSILAFGTSEDLQAASRNLIKCQELLVDNCDSLQKIHTASKISRSIDFSKEGLRVFVTGVYLPASLYFISSLHFVGMFFRKAPSLLIFLVIGGTG